MKLKNKEINFKVFSNIIFIKSILWFKKLKIYFKLIVISVLLIILFLIARLGFFGRPAEKLTYDIYNSKIFPSDVLITVIEKDRLNLELNFSVNAKQGILGHTYFSGDEVAISFGVDKSCYIFLISVDNNGMFDLFQKQFRSQHVSNNYKEIIKFTLDDNVGEETILFLASHNFINYESDVKMKIQRLRESVQKGPNLLKNIKLENDKIFYKIIYFAHK